VQESDSTTVELDLRDKITIEITWALTDTIDFNLGKVGVSLQLAIY